MRALVALVLLGGCAEPATVASSDPGPACMRAVVTDIDATLTTSDDEWLSQMVDATHDPLERPEASELMQDYADLGYAVFYVTARGDQIALTDGRDGRQATVDWLTQHGFPVVESRVHLFDGVGVSGDPAVSYKSEVLLSHSAEGWEFIAAYGDKDTDTLAWQAGGVADDQIWLVGELAGEMGVNGIPDDDAYVTHRSTHMATVGPACP